MFEALVAVLDSEHTRKVFNYIRDQHLSDMWQFYSKYTLT